MIYKISIEGQTLDMPEEIAGDDGKLKSALSPYFPGAANAKFMRSEPKDGVITVTVVKQAGTKGVDIETGKVYLPDGNWSLIDDPMAPFRTQEPEDQVLRKLIDAPEGMNPVVELDRELEGKLLNQMSVEKLLELDAQIDQVTSEGRKERDNLDSMLRSFEHATPQPSTVVMSGF